MVRKQETGGKRMNQEFAENIKNHIREYLRWTIRMQR